MDDQKKSQNIPSDRENLCRINIGEYQVTNKGGMLVTYGLGSCLGVALFDKEASVAGLIHIKRPAISEHNNARETLFADTGIKSMFDDMRSYGATSCQTIAKIAGGSDMEDIPSAVGRGIGEQNIQQAKETLTKLDITVVDTDVGGTSVRSIFFDGHSGNLTIETEESNQYVI